jgi:CheY-like chemotaxis protein
VSSYRRDTHVYFDFVRRKRHTVNVEAIADVGQYSLASEVLRYRPEDSYLAEAVQANGSVAFDRMTQQPTYLSLRFPAATGDKPTQMRHPRLLAIDDQPIILELITSMCQSMGYEVETARSGEEGIRMATSRHFDVVMTDFSMAGISGIEVAKTLHLSRPNLPVILITGWDTGLSHAELASSGICEIVHKPFKIEQLTTILRSVTSKSSA